MLCMYVCMYVCACQLFLPSVSQCSVMQERGVRAQGREVGRWREGKAVEGRKEEEEEEKERERLERSERRGEKLSYVCQSDRHVSPANNCNS